MKTDSTLKRLMPVILAVVFGVALFFCTIALELNTHYNINGFKIMSVRKLIGMFSDAFFVPGVFIFGTALIGFVKYINLGAILYSAFQSIWQRITLGAVPKGSRKVYRKYRRAAREENGTGLAILFAIGFVFLAAAIVLMLWQLF